MRKIILWIKSNKVITVLLIVIIFFLVKDSFKNRPYTTIDSYNRAGVAMPNNFGSAKELTVPSSSNYMPYDGSGGTLQTDNRMVVQESYLSLLVNNVDETKGQILAKTRELGGFMISSSITNPQDNGTATISLRIPADQLENALQSFRSLSVKVVTENLQGDDVTDSYVDIQAQMNTYIKTQSKFEDILDKATDIQDILEVQREIISIQSQIDSLKGRAQYLENSAKMARLTIYLSTDELALPYSPTESWRPQLVVKEAVRSVIFTLRNFANMLIWLVVYSVVWLPILLVLFYVRRRMQRKGLDKAV